MGPSGLRQEHAALHPRRARAAVVRHGHDRRHESVHARRARAGRVPRRARSASSFRIICCCRSSRRSTTCSCRRWSRRRRMATPCADRARNAARRRRPRATRLDHRPASSPAASASASRSRARSSASRRCCSATSRPAISIARRPRPSPTCSSRFTRDQKTMLVVVTHSPALASRFGRRYELNDARLQPVAMTLARLALAGAMFYRRTHVAVVARRRRGRRGARRLAARRRIGPRQPRRARDEPPRPRPVLVVVAETPFTVRSRRAGDGRALRPPARRTRRCSRSPASCHHDASGRRGGDVLVYGVDARFFTFHGVDGRRARRIGRAAESRPRRRARRGAGRRPARSRHAADRHSARLAARPARRRRPIDPAELARRTVERESMGEFSLAPGQGPVRAVFVALARLQRDLGLAGPRQHAPACRAMHATIASQVTRRRFARSVTAADLGLKLARLPDRIDRRRILGRPAARRRRQIDRGHCAAANRSRPRRC